MSLEKSRELTLNRLQDVDWTERLDALRALADDDDPSLVNELLPLVDDEDSDVRIEALRVLAKFADRRVLSALIAALDDNTELVREQAEALLNGQHGSLPALARLTRGQHDEAVWQKLRVKAAAVERWASQIGQELLGKPVIVRRYQQGLGRTSKRRKQQPVEIEINEAPVTSGHRHGEDIMRGLALHEIGHHLADFAARGHKTTRGIARSEGIDDIYDILCDERLERQLRARRPQWGIYFDRLASYAFAQGVRNVPLEDYAALVQKEPKEVVAALQRRTLPGRLLSPAKIPGEQTVALRDTDLLALPHVLPPLAAFLSCLRCGLNPRRHSDLRVSQAIALVPRNLKVLPHPEVLKVARKIAETLGTNEQRQRDMEQMQRRIRQFPRALQGLRGMLDRMGSTNRLPETMRPKVVTKESRRQTRPVSPLVGSSPFGSPARGTPNLNPERDFPPLNEEQTLPYDLEQHQQIVATIRSHVRRLRAYLEQLGKQTIEEYASHRGWRLDVAQARKIAYLPHPNLLVFARDEVRPDAYLGILIDRSGSMEGERIARAKAFATLVAESAKELPGIEGHINAFDDDTFYRLGDLQRNAIASLTAGGGNNDSGALARAADLALRSRKKNKLLIILSDGAPAECSFASLKHLVARLTHQYGILCAQVAVAEIEEIAFPHYIDLSQYPLNEAVARFGSLLRQLTAMWR